MRQIYGPTNINVSQFITSLSVMLFSLACAAGNSADESDFKAGDTPDKVDELIGGKVMKDSKMTRDQQIEFATEHLVNKLNVELSQISAVDARGVTWRSSALGCPKSNKAYMQVVTKGVLILLKSGDHEYRYHANEHGLPFFCPDNMAELPNVDEAEI